MAKPPETTPHSDIDGVHRDEKENRERAQDSGKPAADLKLARDESVGKPPHTDKEGRDEDR